MKYYLVAFAYALFLMLLSWTSEYLGNTCSVKYCIFMLVVTTIVIPMAGIATIIVLLQSGG